jgi:hypothetical protein
LAHPDKLLEYFNEEKEYYKTELERSKRKDEKKTLKDWDNYKPKYTKRLLELYFERCRKVH